MRLLQAVETHMPAHGDEVFAVGDLDVGSVDRRLDEARTAGAVELDIGPDGALGVVPRAVTYFTRPSDVA
ncbi:hypothetical protein HR12_44975 [Microbacterium sp. SUBG005]|nr:hypothetical protein HR12_44975 [Microbacterium sp. SUBG005]